MSYTIKNETISNDIVFEIAVRQNPKLAKHLIALSTDKNDSTLESGVISNQKDNKPTLYSKGTRFDIFLATDRELYDLEMQKYEAMANDIVLRARYYASSSDVTDLQPGKNYRNLKSLTLIFLCTFDPFKKGYAKYIVKERVFVDNKNTKDITESIGYDCNVKKIFFNSSKCVSVMNVKRSMANVLHLLATNQSTDKFTKELKEAAEEIVQTRGEEIMTLEQKFEDIKYFSELENSKKIAISLLKNGCTPEFVAENTGLPLEEVKKIQSENECN